MRDDIAGLMGALFPIVVADLTRGSGHFAAAQGAVGTAHQIGAVASMALGGVLAAWGGYDAALPRARRGGRPGCRRVLAGAARNPRRAGDGDGQPRRREAFGLALPRHPRPPRATTATRGGQKRGQERMRPAQRPGSTRPDRGPERRAGPARSLARLIVRLVAGFAGLVVLVGLIAFAIAAAFGWRPP